MTDVEHLLCAQCDDAVSVARIEGVGCLVCHCTYVDGPLDPVVFEGPEWAIRIPDEWHLVTEGAEEGDHD